MAHRLILDLPTELSFRIGRSIEKPIVCSAAVGSPEWIAETEAVMRSLRDEAWRQGDWSRFIFRHVREHRWRALGKVAAFSPRLDITELFREVWIDSEDIWRERKTVKTLIALIGANRRRKLFTDDDRTRFNSLPGKITIYRGAKEWNRRGMSWTLDLQRAVYFATYTNSEGMACSLPPDLRGFVMERTVRKSAILFYTNERNEDEVVLPRFEMGSRSPEGQLWVAREYGADAFAAELKRQRKHLPAEVIQQATRYVECAREIEADSA
jgi:hypothetical protein